MSSLSPTSSPAANASSPATPAKTAPPPENVPPPPAATANPPPKSSPAAPPPTTPSAPPPTTPPSPPPPAKASPPPVTTPPASPSTPPANSSSQTPTAPSPPPSSSNNSSTPPPSNSSSTARPPSASVSPPGVPSTTPASLTPPPPATPSLSPPELNASTPAPRRSTHPPPPHSSKTSPTTTRTPPSSSSSHKSSSTSSSSISTGLVAGLVVGGVALLLAICCLIICCRKKRRRGGDEAAYYGHQHYRGPKSNVNGNFQQPWQKNNGNGYAIAMPNNGIPPASSAFMYQQDPSAMQQTYFNSGGSASSYSGSEKPSAGMALGLSKNAFTYEELARATDGFSDANLLGQGGFGYVHKGVLANGQEVAIKQLKAGSGQGEREFQAEVEIISRVHHRHLVSLVGYCMTGTQRLLVYEFVPNNTLEFHLHGKGRPTMDWPTRLTIALGSAKGLAYLHEDCHPKIIHRDIKASNILLDFKFEAKVADFGLAKFSSDMNTHVSTRVMGTFGYLAPEYASSGKLTEKSDVFSFGVMLLELITGRRPVDTTQSMMDDSLVDWAKPLMARAIEDGNFDALADSKLQSNYDRNEMARMVFCAAASVRHSARRRPRMSQIVRALEGDMSLDDLDEGIKRGHHGVPSSGHGSSDYDTTQYNEDIKKFRKMALESQEYGASCEYSDNGAYGTGSSSESRQNTREMNSHKFR